MKKKDKKHSDEIADVEEEVLEGEIEAADSQTEEINELEAANLKNAELVDRLTRSMAEFDNFRKRTIKEKSEMYDIGVISAVEKLLPVVDNFERAVKAFKDPEENMAKGVIMIYKQLNEALDGLGVEAIECIGGVFNPNLHNAVAHEENDDYEENTVIEELQKGYKYKDKVIRPSMVKVAN